MPNHESNRHRKALEIARLLFEAGISLEQAIDAPDKTKQLLAELTHQILGTQKARPISEETYADAMIELMHKWDEAKYKLRLVK